MSFLAAAPLICRPCRGLFRRDVLPKPSVEDRAKFEKWDPGFTKEVMAHAGEQIVAMSGWGSNDSMRFAGDRLYVDEMRDFCEVFYAFYKGQDQSGNRRIMVTIFHPSTKTVGRTLPNPYLHGKYPFVLCMREKRSRSAIESRGVGDIEMTHQSEIKNQRDSRNDRTSLGTLPPLQVPLGRGKTQYRLGPRAQLQVMRAGELAWLQPPPLDQETFEVENTIIRSAYNYWGKSVEGVDPNKVLRKQQRLIDSWLGELRAVYVQIYQLCEQYMDPQDWIAISGDPQSVPGQDRQLDSAQFKSGPRIRRERLKYRVSLEQNAVDSDDVGGHRRGRRDRSGGIDDVRGQRPGSGSRAQHCEAGRGSYPKRDHRRASCLRADRQWSRAAGLSDRAKTLNCGYR